MVLDISIGVIWSHDVVHNYDTQFKSTVQADQRLTVLKQDFHRTEIYRFPQVNSEECEVQVFSLNGGARKQRTLLNSTRRHH